jgi:hypothetical protein
MRLVHVLVLIVGLVGCTRSNGLYIGDDGGGGGGSDGGSDDLASCGGCADAATLDLSKPPHDLSMPPKDLNGAMCGATGGCPTGPLCGTTCCGTGQRCDGNTCKCGSNAACAVGEICSAGGPIGGTGQCGTICCGGVGNPCPL